MLTLIENGEIYAPEPLGKNSILLGAGAILKEGKAADVLVLEKKSFELREVISGGRRLFKDGAMAFREAFLEESNRDIKLKGAKKSKR
jgi:adenine deaminase